MGQPTSYEKYLMKRLRLIAVLGCLTMAMIPFLAAQVYFITRPADAGEIEVAPPSYLIAPQNIVSVYDGDTFFIRVPECENELPWLCRRLGVRVVGIDAPERRGKCLEEVNLALQARDHLADLLENAEHIELFDVGRDKYGRLLGRLYIDDRDVLEELVLGGMARPYDGGTRRGWCGEGPLAK